MYFYDNKMSKNYNLMYYAETQNQKSQRMIQSTINHYHSVLVFNAEMDLPVSSWPARISNTRDKNFI